MSENPVKRIDPRLVASIEQFRISYAAKNGNVPRWPEATRLFAEHASTPYDEVTQALRRMGRAKL